MSFMSLLLNILWIAFGGLWMSIAWIVAAVIMDDHDHRPALGPGGDQHWYLHAPSVRPEGRAARASIPASKTRARDYSALSAI